MNFPLSIRPRAKPLLASSLGLGLLIPAQAQEESVLRVNMHSDLRTVNPNRTRVDPVF